jgi:hypothetical protein
MKRVLVVAAVLVALGWVVFSQGRYSWHQKLTIIVETPAGEVSASSVSSIIWRKHESWWSVLGWSYDVTGEALVVEVTPGRYLLALMRGKGTTEYMGSVAPASIAGREGRGLNLELFSELLSEVNYSRGRAAGVIPVAEVWYPVLVTFDDITKPETVRVVDPENLAAVFGQGVRLKAVTLDITEEAVTEGRVEGVLEWMPNYQEAHINPKVDHTDVSLPAPLWRGDFIRRDGAL